jgi:hypothetical protein
LAVLSTVAHDHHAILLNISRAGACLKAPVLPAEGEELRFRAASVQAYGRIVWSRGEQCGVAFEPPMAPNDVEHLRVEGNLPSLCGLSAEEKAAAQEWQLGISG